MMETLSCSNHWLQLPESFYQRCPPTPLNKPTLLHVNQALFNLLGIQGEQLNTKQLLDCFNGDKLLAVQNTGSARIRGHARIQNTGSSLSLPHLYHPFS